MPSVSHSFSSVRGRYGDELSIVYSERLCPEDAKRMSLSEFFFFLTKKRKDIFRGNVRPCFVCATLAANMVFPHVALIVRHEPARAKGGSGKKKGYSKSILGKQK